MNKSESINELAKALCAAQLEVQNALADSDNPFFKTKYADLTSVIKSVRPTFNKHGLSIIQLPISDTYPDKAWIGVETILMHESGQWLSQHILVPMTKQDAQAAGSVISYCRRYALSALACIGQTDDDGEGATDKEKHDSHKDNNKVIHYDDIPDTTSNAGLTPQYALMNMVRSHNVAPERVRKWCEHFKVASIQDMTEQQATQMINKLKDGK